MERERVSAALVALGATALLAVVLIALAVFDAKWLGVVAVGLLFVALIASRVTGVGLRWFLVGTALTIVSVGALVLILRLAR